MAENGSNRKAIARGVCLKVLVTRGFSREDTTMWILNLLCSIWWLLEFDVNKSCSWVCKWLHQSYWHKWTPIETKAATGSSLWSTDEEW